MKIIRRIIGTTLYIAMLPGLHLVLQNSRRTRVVLRSQGQVLLVQPFLGRGGWDLPGGGIKRNEDDAVAACRELKEELGLHIAPNQLVSLGEAEVRSPFFRYTAVYFMYDCKDKPQLQLQQAELLDSAWMDPIAVTVRVSPETYRRISNLVY